MIEINDTEFELLKEYLSTMCGINIPPEKRYLFVTRLAGMLDEMKCSSFSEFYNFLSMDRDPLLKKRLVEAMTTHETSFFRDGHPWETLTRSILPGTARVRLKECRYMNPRIRILSSGCCTGEEPYSIAMSVCEWIENTDSFSMADISILAVDISKKALDSARNGVYPEHVVRKNIPEAYIQKYFREARNGMMVREKIRAMCVFAEVNLAEPFEHLGMFDLIFCRNVIIYFSTELKKKIIEQFFSMLNHEGALVMGASENLYTISDRFSIIPSDSRTTYYRKHRFNE